MFWTFIRWGGTLIIMLLVLAAALLGYNEEIAAAVQPAAPDSQPSKNFNL